MGLNKRLINVGAEAAEAAFDPLQNFETVTYTGNGGTQKITGYIRKGAAFNGSSSSLDIESLDLIQNQIESFSFWFRGKFVLGFYDPSVASSSDRRRWFIDNTTTGSIKIQVNNDQYNYEQTGITEDSDWHHLAVVSNGKIYLDGTQLTNTFNTSYWITDGTNGTYRDTIRIGSSDFIGSASQSYSEGSYDQVRFFNKALSTNNNGVNEIDELYNEEYGDAKNSVTDFFGDGSGVALYELDEDANDTAGAGTNGKFGDAAFFNGSSSVFDTNVSVPTNWSVSLWLNRTPDGYFGGTTNSQVRNGVYFYSNSNGSLQVYNRNNSGGNIDTLTTSTGLVTEGTFHHIAITFDSTSGTGLTTVYVDGTSAGTLDGTPTHSTDFKFGRSGDYAVEYFNGKIDDIRIYSDVLSLAEVGYIYNNTTASIPTDNLTAHYKLDGDASDETSNDNDGTTTNVSFGYDGTPTNINFLGMAFQPDFVWIKNRDYSSGISHQIFDSVRGDTTGAGGSLSSNSTDDEYFDGTKGVSSFDSNGFTVDGGTNGQYGVNGSVGGTYGSSYVAWCWKAADTTTTIAANTVGNTIASDVRANTAAGFSIVSYTGNGVQGATVAHGLSSAPELIIAKGRDTNNSGWRVGATPIGWQYYMGLDSTNQAFVASSIWNSTAPTSSVFSLGNNADANGNGQSKIAYCFHSVDGYQKVGSYSGSSSSDNPVYTTDDGTSSGTGGFKPRWVMIKSTGANSGSWTIYDAVRDTDGELNEYLFADENDDEGTAATAFIEPISNGFKVNSNSEHINQSGYTYIYLAIA